MRELVTTTLEDRKGEDVVCLDVRKLTSVADYMVVATGTSGRHVKALADEIMKKAKDAGHPARGVEGETQAEWVLLDLGDVIVHIMQSQVRRLYDLESLWSIGVSREE